LIPAISGRTTAPGSQGFLLGFRGTARAKLGVGCRFQPFGFDHIIAGPADTRRQGALIAMPSAFDGGLGEQSRDIGGEVDFVHVILPDEKPLPQYWNNSASERFVHLSQG
jgi:hypothetical protein